MPEMSSVLALQFAPGKEKQVLFPQSSTVWKAPPIYAATSVRLFDDEDDLDAVTQNPE